MNAAMQIPRKAKRVTNLCLRNAYQMKPFEEYNSGKSLRHPTGMKMYAGLTGNGTVRSQDKKPGDNTSWFDEDGTVFLRVSDDDSYEARYGGYLEVYMVPNFQGIRTGLAT